MPRVFALLVLTFAIGGARLSFAGEPFGPPLPITIQIHDYWHVPSASLARARSVVTAMYERIGVHTEWMGVVQQNEKRPGSAPRGSVSRVPVAQVTVIILTPKMAARGRVPESALGYAAVPDEGMGRIAYAIYDRVRDKAVQAAMNEDDLLGFVMAHEIAHLMLPRGSHVDSGLMRGRWDVQDLQKIDVLELEFSPRQASTIRNTLLRHSPTVAGDTAAAEATR